MSRDKFNVNKIIEESILEAQESDKGLEKDEGVIEESVNPVIQNFLGEFDIQAQFEALTGLAEKINGLPRVKAAAKLFEGEGEGTPILAKTLNVESDELTENVVNFIKGGVVEESAIPESAGLASGLGALSFAKKLRRVN